MSIKHRVTQAVVKMDRDGQNWAYETWSDGTTAYFSFEDSRSAELLSWALRHMFKSLRPPLIHNGHKPRGKRK